MGKCESSSVYIGINILISELINQINESNFILIKQFLQQGFIEDMNDFHNNTYNDIIFDNKYDDNCNIENYKNYIINDLKKECLYEKTILIPIELIIDTERWGYNRYGTNGTFRDLDFDINSIKNKIDDKYNKNISNYKIVMIIKQNSG